MALSSSPIPSWTPDYGISSGSPPSWPLADDANGVNVFMNDASLQDAHIEGAHMGDPQMYNTHIDVANFEEPQFGDAHIEDAHITVAAHMFTEEQFNTLLSRIFDNSTSSNDTAQPTQPENSSITVPPFPDVQADQPFATTIESLLDQFPFVHRATILEIIQFKFSALDLHKLNPTATLESKDTVAKDYPSLASLMEPLFVYFQILGCYAASSNSVKAVLAINRAALAYCNHLSSLNGTYDWYAILRYHSLFFHRRSREMAHGNFSGWLSPDNELVCRLLVGYPLPQVSSSTPRFLFILFLFIILLCIFLLVLQAYLILSVA